MRALIIITFVTALCLAGCEERERPGSSKNQGGGPYRQEDPEERERREREKEEKRKEKEEQERIQYIIDRNEVLGLVETALQESVELDGRWSALNARVLDLNDRYDTDELFRDRLAADTRHRTIWWELRRGAPEYVRKALGYVEVLRDLKAKLLADSIPRPKQFLRVVYAAHDHHVALAAAIHERNRAATYMERYLPRVARPVTQTTMKGP